MPPKDKAVRMPSLLVKVPAKKPTTAKVEYRAVFALLFAVGSSWPPPPIPLSALNMPGHMKQTKDTMTSCTGGEANQGSLRPKMVKDLYFQLAGSCRVPPSIECWDEVASSETGVFSWVAMLWVTDVCERGCAGLNDVCRVWRCGGDGVTGRSS